MKHVPEQLQQFRNEKKYYEATELLKNSGTHQIAIHVNLACSISKYFRRRIIKDRSIERIASRTQTTKRSKFYQLQRTLSQYLKGFS